LRSAEEIAKQLGRFRRRQRGTTISSERQASYIKKLWNGEYFRYDTEANIATISRRNQLAGNGIATMTGLRWTFPRQCRSVSLKKIYAFNVLKFADGSLGAVNGIAPDGSLVKTNEQVEEVWTGTTFALPALMSRRVEGRSLPYRWGLYHTSYERRVIWFRTPEAWTFPEIIAPPCTCAPRPFGPWR